MAVPVAAAHPGLESSMLARAARIMYCFTASAPELTLTDVARRTGLPRSSVHRILDQLVQLRALERTDSRYRLGLGLIELGALAAQQNRLRETAFPHLHRLHTATRALVHLAVPDGHEIVYLEKVGGAPAGGAPTRMGGRQPAYCTGAGKAMLAFADEEDVARVLGAGLAPRTPATITDPRAFRRELAGIRERGVALDREENHRGVVCVATPLRDGLGRPVAAISLCGPPSRLNPQALTPSLLMAAREVRRALAADRR
ncbi:IclR family transcriptional regulator [Actinocorallia populi]|uniref:IclR family transcriptional regulator n=1 Tax=Actinocorallia populi TaxID=2079200 RepID=UPI000D0865CE|nr:IclR family transcriptional regulator [Actinocorallia populi]